MMMNQRLFNAVVTLLFIVCLIPVKSSSILIPMGENNQTNHLKAYGVAFWTLENGAKIEWLLNYQGGSFLAPAHPELKKECILRGVSFQEISDTKVQEIKDQILSPNANMDIVLLEKAPKIAVYTPSGKQPWDDAVTLVLTYAEIPYTTLYDEEVIEGQLNQYDWLHLHHEDFTGQYGKFYAAYKNATWYNQQVESAEESAAKLGFNKVSQLKLAVAENIKNFVLGGGFLFAMCSGTDSYDIALAASNTDICATMFDHDPIHPNCQSELNFSNCIAFTDFNLKLNPMEYEYSTIDATQTHSKIPENNDYFSLFEFSAKWDQVPAMLTQNHQQIIKGFMGQTTAYYINQIKPDVIIMGASPSVQTARYLHGNLGMGQWTFYGGHDPEDYQHFVGDPFTELKYHPNSPGYRLILNNVLFPAAKKKKQKT